MLLNTEPLHGTGALAGKLQPGLEGSQTLHVDNFCHLSLALIVTSAEPSNVVFFSVVPE